MDKDNKKGFFTWPTLYRDLVSRFPDNSIFVEIGVFKGQSLLFLINEINKQAKKINVIAVDSFEGNWSKYETEFLKNTTGQKFRFIKSKSVDAAKLFTDNSIDVVFIDASHEYEDVKDDIHSWLPKIKEGGLITGHDYIPTYPGVIKAVNERFGKKIDSKYFYEGCWKVEIK